MSSSWWIYWSLPLNKEGAHRLPQRTPVLLQSLSSPEAAFPSPFPPEEERVTGFHLSAALGSSEERGAVWQPPHAPTTRSQTVSQYQPFLSEVAAVREIIKCTCLSLSSLSVEGALLQMTLDTNGSFGFTLTSLLSNVFFFACLTLKSMSWTMNSKTEAILGILRMSMESEHRWSVIWRSEEGGQRLHAEKS